MTGFLFHSGIWLLVISVAVSVAVLVRENRRIEREER